MQEARQAICETASLTITSSHSPYTFVPPLAKVVTAKNPTVSLRWAPYDDYTTTTTTTPCPVRPIETTDTRLKLGAVFGDLTSDALCRFVLKLSGVLPHVEMLGRNHGLAVLSVSCHEQAALYSAFHHRVWMTPHGALIAGCDQSQQLLLHFLYSLRMDRRGICCPRHLTTVSIWVPLESKNAMLSRHQMSSYVNPPPYEERPMAILVEQ